jgi:hypothetical protein
MLLDLGGRPRKRGRRYYIQSVMPTTHTAKELGTISPLSISLPNPPHGRLAGGVNSHLPAVRPRGGEATTPAIHSPSTRVWSHPNALSLPDGPDSDRIEYTRHHFLPGGVPLGKPVQSYGHLPRIPLKTPHKENKLGNLTGSYLLDKEHFEISQGQRI